METLTQSSLGYYDVSFYSQPREEGCSQLISKLSPTTFILVNHSWNYGMSCVHDDEGVKGIMLQIQYSTHQGAEIGGHLPNQTWSWILLTHFYPQLWISPWQTQTSTSLSVLTSFFSLKQVCDGKKNNCNVVETRGRWWNNGIVSKEALVGVIFLPRQQQFTCEF